MSEAADLYETDLARWAETQARALRDAAVAGVDVPVDWANVAEEIESLARTDRRRLRSSITTIIEHLLKLQFSPAPEPRKRWRETIQRARGAIELVIEDSPSLRRELPSMVVASRTRAVDLAARSLDDHGELTAAVAAKLHGGAYGSDDVLSDDFFAEAAEPVSS